MKYLMLTLKNIQEIFSLVLAAQCEWKTETVSEVRYSGGGKKKKSLLSQSQGIAKQAFTSDPPMLILQSPVIITLS